VSAFVVALLPIAVSSEELFAMYMVQHLLLIIAPPLILPGAPLLRGLPARQRRTIGRLLPPGQLLSLIGVLLTFSSRPLHDTYAHHDTKAVWGPSTLDDQQLGGLIVWVPDGMLFLIPLIGLLVRLLQDEERTPSHRQALPGRR
jgi:cytochrome c oxidase assembly factor CtaG